MAGCHPNVASSSQNRGLVGQGHALPVALLAGCPKHRTNNLLLQMEIHSLGRAWPCPTNPQVSILRKLSGIGMPSCARVVNPRSLRSFVTQRDNRIHSHGSPGRQVAGPEGVHGELINSGGDGRLVQPSTVTPPGVRIEGYWRRRSVHTRFWQASFQSGMRSMTIIVMLEID
jgi:hypothetical protein